MTTQDINTIEAVAKQYASKLHDARIYVRELDGALSVLSAFIPKEDHQSTERDWVIDRMCDTITKLLEITHVEGGRNA